MTGQAKSPTVRAAALALLAFGIIAVAQAADQNIGKSDEPATLPRLDPDRPYSLSIGEWAFDFPPGFFEGRRPLGMPREEGRLLEIYEIDYPELFRGKKLISVNPSFTKIQVSFTSDLTNKHDVNLNNNMNMFHRKYANYSELVTAQDVQVYETTPQFSDDDAPQRWILVKQNKDNIGIFCAYRTCSYVYRIFENQTFRLFVRFPRELMKHWDVLESEIKDYFFKYLRKPQA